ncbi:hypothetical protein ABZV92_18620 [Streptomyces rubiginosohelvolus]|uniref:hypothetical protein n=1 Tax=Streptomyces rubiginosohelvolus TaxID=67362 RepID=UPI0033AB50A1
MSDSSGTNHWVLVLWTTEGAISEELLLHYLSSHDRASVEALASLWVERHLTPENPRSIIYLGPSALPLRPPLHGT